MKATTLEAEEGYGIGSISDDPLGEVDESTIGILYDAGPDFIEDGDDIGDGFEDDVPSERNEEESQNTESRNEENTKETLPTVNREEIARRLEEHFQSEEQRQEEDLHILQEKQKENEASAARGGKSSKR